MFGKKTKCYTRPFCQLKNCNRLAAMLTTMIEDGQSVMCDNKKLYKERGCYFHDLGMQRGQGCSEKKVPWKIRKSCLGLYSKHDRVLNNRIMLEFYHLSSTFQSLMVCVSTSKLMPTFTIGRPQRAKRFAYSFKSICFIATSALWFSFNSKR